MPIICPDSLNSMYKRDLGNPSKEWWSIHNSNRKPCSGSHSPPWPHTPSSQPAPGSGTVWSTLCQLSILANFFNNLSKMVVSVITNWQLQTLKFKEVTYLVQDNHQQWKQDASLDSDWSAPSTSHACHLLWLCVPHTDPNCILSRIRLPPICQGCSHLISVVSHFNFRIFSTISLLLDNQHVQTLAHYGPYI